MITLVVAAVWVGLGLALRLPRRTIGAGLAALWLAVVLAHLVLPPSHALLLALGGTLQHWLALGVGTAIVFGYRAGLGVLRRRAAAPAPLSSGSFTSTELDRYARHIVLRELGGAGQKRLKSARVLVVGAGGLGSPALLYLAASGVGRIAVIDDDIVSNPNLQRQIIHTDARIGMAKVTSARSAMVALNPFIEVEAINQRLGEGAAELFARFDLILDGSDNFATRFLVNAAAVAAGKPLISGAITQWEAQLSLFDPANGGPCYACVFPEAPAAGLAPNCSEAGVVAPLPGVVGSMMALEAIKQITGAGAGLRGQMLIYDGLWGETRKIGLTGRTDCPVCHGKGSGSPTK